MLVRSRIGIFSIAAIVGIVFTVLMIGVKDPVQPSGPQALPPPAMKTASAILDAAEAGDLGELAALALDGGTEFRASFEGSVSTPEELVSTWESIGRDEVLDTVIGLARLPNWYETRSRDADGERVATFVSPRFMHEPTEANRQDVEDAFGIETVEASIGDGHWLGWRLGVTAGGDWQFLLTGGN